MSEHKSEIIKLSSFTALFFVLLILTHFITFPFWLEILSFGVLYLAIGLDVIKEAVENIVHGEFFDECFLMSIATVGAFAIGEYAEAVFVMLFFSLGELFEEIASFKSRKSITSLMDLREENANLLENGEIKTVPANSIKIGDIIEAHTGERIPLDGIVISGSSLLDTSAITGESVMRRANENTEVLSGFLVSNGVLRIKVTSTYDNCTVSKILDLIENSSSGKSKPERFIRKFSKIYTPAVVCLAVLLAVIPSLIWGNANKWIYSALSFLVVSCPCALVVSVPLAFFCAIGSASKKGVLIKGSFVLENLVNTKTVVFDKTGTLTKGNFSVSEVFAVNGDKMALLKIAASVEKFSEHPVALPIKLAAGDDFSKMNVTDFEEISGKGIKAKVNAKNVLIGNKKLMDDYGIICTNHQNYGTAVNVAEGGEYLGYIIVSDSEKETSKDCIADLKKYSVDSVMLTGDNFDNAESTAEKLSIEEFYAELLPDEKVEWIKKIKDRIPKGKTVAFAGDGINDAPVLALSDIGIAMGALGSDAAIEAADIVLTDDDPKKIITALKISKKALKIVKQNIFVSIFVKTAVLVMSAFAIKNIMWFAVLADVGVLILAVANSVRSMRI